MTEQNYQLLLELYQKAELRDVRYKGAKVLLSILQNSPADMPKAQRDHIQRAAEKLLLDEDYSNVSVKHLRDKLLSDYIFDASALILAANNKNVRAALIPIRKIDEDLLDDLKANWVTKGFTYGGLVSSLDTETHFTVSLTW